MATLRDIAQHFDLSESTVSRVLNGKGRVGESTRRKVLEYAEAIDYHPNRVAMSLKLRSATTVGVVVPDIGNEFYALLFKAIEADLAASGLTPMLFNIGEEPEREADFVAHLRSSMVDGMIIATAGGSAYAKLPDRVLRKIVFVDNRPDMERPLAFVGADNIQSSAELTKHLIDRGHTRIATIVGAMGESSANDRLTGFQEQLTAHGLDLPSNWIARTNFQYADGLAKAERLLSAGERPTAVIAQNNVLAYATIRVAKLLGLRVPRDLAVACFDHIDPYGFMRPIITTTVQPIRDMAQRACALLQAGINNEDNAGRHLLQSEFRLGETT